MSFIYNIKYGDNYSQLELKDYIIIRNLNILKYTNIISNII
jgi:hypothetical protein